MLDKIEKPFEAWNAIWSNEFWKQNKKIIQYKIYNLHLSQIQKHRLASISTVHHETIIRSATRRFSSEVPADGFHPMLNPNIFPHLLLDLGSGTVTSKLLYAYISSNFPLQFLSPQIYRNKKFFLKASSNCPHISETKTWCDYLALFTTQQNSHLFIQNSTDVTKSSFQGSYCGIWPLSLPLTRVQFLYISQAFLNTRLVGGFYFYRRTLLRLIFLTSEKHKK